MELPRHLKPVIAIVSRVTKGSSGFSAGDT
jgi:hypothetical protein